MSVWKFSIQGEEVSHGNHRRRKLTSRGCNEPYRDYFWCPKLQWFRKESCPFVSLRECENFKTMCGAI